MKKVVGATEFKAKCLKLIDQVHDTGKPITITKRGKPVAVLQPLSAEELEQLVRATIQELGATGKKDMGPVIKAVQAKAAGRADGKSISGLVGRLLP